MKFIPQQIIDLITDKYISSEVTITEPGEIYCKTLYDECAKIHFKNGLYYEGNVVNGILQGVGSLTLSNGIKFTGNFEDNQIKGVVQIDYGKGEKYKGEIQELKRNGNGEYENENMKLKYNGKWEDDQFHGKGILTLLNQWEYEGDFQMGLKQGEGQVKYLQNGNLFKGIFQENKKNGFGKMFWKEQKQQYEGQWVNDIMEGYGRYIYLSELSYKKPLRNYYIGEFKNNNRNGFGIHYYSDLSCYIGFWENGIKTGKSIFIDSLGYSHIKNFQNNHLVSSDRIEFEGKRDYSIPHADILEEMISESWNYEVIENVVKTLNSQLKSIYEKEISKSTPVNDVIQAMNISQFKKILFRLRIYDTELDEKMVLYILKSNRNCYFQTNIQLNEFLNIKQKFSDFLNHGTHFYIQTKFDMKTCVLSYRNFLNSLLLILQKKYATSKNIEGDIREFLQERVIKILNNKLKAKEWVKEEKFNLLKFKKPIQKSIANIEDYFSKNSYQSLIMNRDILNFLVQQECYQHQDLDILLKILERNNDPINSVFDEMRRQVDEKQCYQSQKFFKLMMLTKTLEQFQNDITLFLYYKNLNQKDIISKTSHQLENLNKINTQFRYGPRLYLHKEIEIVHQQSVSDQLDKTQNEEVINQQQIEDQDWYKECLLMQKNDFNALDFEQSESNFKDDDFYKNGYFIKLSTKEFKQEQFNFNQLDTP